MVPIMATAAVAAMAAGPLGVLASPAAVSSPVAGLPTTMDIPEDDVPLTEIPDSAVPQAEGQEEEILDEDVPLADAPETGDASMSWFLAAIASALGLAGLTIADRKRKSEDAE